VTFSDYAEVVERLYLGSDPSPEDVFERGATMVVSLIPDVSSRSVPRSGILIHWPIKDGPVPPPEILDGVASLIEICRRSGSVVYVHCAAGMNRSALVVARVLMKQGMSAQDAIDLVRQRRVGSLGDEYAAWLLSNPIPLTTLNGAEEEACSRVSSEGGLPDAR
jgi:hypothetical protein